MIHADTGFLVDLQREVSRKPGPATAFLSEHSGDAFGISVFALCELEAGVKLARDPERERTRLAALLRGLSLAYPDHRLVTQFGATYLALERSGKRMPAMDLLIAVSALVEGAELVTPNPKHFSGVPGLRVLTY